MGHLHPDNPEVPVKGTGISMKAVQGTRGSYLRGTMHTESLIDFEICYGPFWAYSKHRLSLDSTGIIMTIL